MFHQPTYYWALCFYLSSFTILLTCYVIILLHLDYQIYLLSLRKVSYEADLQLLLAGYTEALDDNIEISVPDDDHGLYAIDILDPSWVRSVNRYFMCCSFVMTSSSASSSEIVSLTCFSWSLCLTCNLTVLFCLLLVFPVCKAFPLDGGLSLSRYDRNAGWMWLQEGDYIIRIRLRFPAKQQVISKNFSDIVI